MKLKSQMQKAKVLTIESGILQAQYNGVLFQDYDERFSQIQFAGDAKQIFEALSVLNDTIFCTKNADDSLIITDGFQEFKIAKEIPDVILTKPVGSITGNTESFSNLRPFVTQDYPAYFCTKDYTEVIHPSMIVRGKSYGIDAIISPCDLSKQTMTYLKIKQGLWINLGNFASVCMGYLDIEKPNTDIYFKNFVSLHLFITCSIPEVIKNRWVPCHWAEFTSDGLLLDDRVLIEEVKGHGKYDGKLFSKVIRNCDMWVMDKDLMYFSNDQIKGVLENVKH